MDSFHPEGAKTKKELFLYAMMFHLGRMEDLLWEENFEGPEWRKALVHHFQKISEAMAQVKLVE